MKKYKVITHDHNYISPRVKRVLRGLGIMKDFIVYEREPSVGPKYYELGLVVKTKHFTEQITLRTDEDPGLGMAMLAFGNPADMVMIKRRFKGKTYQCSIPCQE